MVKIKKGLKTMIVPDSSYKNFYEDAGWERIGVSKKSDSAKQKEESVDMEEDWDNLDDGIEKPLSDMNRAELFEKAESLGIDISDCANNKQMREKIRMHLS